ncbi:MAG: hypothetical protein Q3999_00835 [Buchananella hordeovulneris]|nr:hypothetical protein [Buchananella hordeovulneris]
MVATSIYIAPPSLRPLLEAMLDLSATGVVGDFHWLEAPADPQAQPDCHDPHLVQVSGGRAALVNLASVEQHPATTSVRYIYLVPVGNPRYPAATRTAEIFYRDHALGQALKARFVRLLIPLGLEPDPNARGEAGCFDIMLSSELSIRPSAGPVYWEARKEEIWSAAAVGVAAQGACLQGVPEAPTDRLHEDNDTHVNVVRTFVDLVDAGEVMAQVKAKTLDLSHLPRLRNRSGHAIARYPEPALATRDVADRWAQLSAPQVVRQTSPLPQTHAVQMGIGEALKEFFSFMGQALRSAPRTWMMEKLFQARAVLSSGVCNYLYGNNDSVQLVLGGVTSEGVPADWHQIQTAAAYTSPGLANMAGCGQFAPPNFAGLWKTLVSGATSLVDSQGQPELGVTPGEYYVDDPTLVAPYGPAAAFTLPTTVGSLRQGATLRPWQALELDNAAAELHQHASAMQPNSAQAGALLNQLSAWRQEHSFSYLPRVGAHLASWLQSQQEEGRKLLEQFRQLESQELEAQISRQERKFKVISRVLLGILLLVLIGSGVMAGLDLLGFTWPIFAAVAGGAIVSWLVGMFIAFWVTHKSIFQLLRQRSASPETKRILEQNIAAVVENIGNISRCYGQFLVWAELLSTFMANPLDRTSQEEEKSRPASALPINVRSHKLTASPQEVENCAARLRGAVFLQGWLSEAWSAFEQTVVHSRRIDADDRLGINKAELSVYGSEAAPGSPLTQWLAGVQSEGLGSRYNETLWDRCLTLLQTRSSELISLTAQGDFAAEAPLEPQAGGTSSTELLTAVALVGEKAKVDVARNWFYAAREGLSATQVLVQSTVDIPASEFKFAVQEQPQHERKPSPEAGGHVSADPFPELPEPRW